MANWSNLKSSVSSVIKNNENNEITGQALQNVLNAIISNLGANAQFAGIATPETAPGTPDGNVFYLASQPGDYSNFTKATIKDGELSMLIWDGYNWTKKPILINDSVGTEKIADGAVTSEKIKDFAVTNEKIADGSIGESKLGFGCVRTNNIYEKAVSPNKQYRDFRVSSYVGETPIEIDKIENEVVDIRTQSFHFSIDNINSSPYEYLLSSITDFKVANGDMLISVKGCYIGYDDDSPRVTKARGVYDNSCCPYNTTIEDYLFSPVLQGMYDKGVTKLQGFIIIEYAFAG